LPTRLNLGRLRNVDKAFPDTRSHLTLREPPGSYEICLICRWEDDLVRLRWPTFRGGANEPSLVEAQRNFVTIGACEERLLKHVQAPRPDESRDMGWRPVADEDDFEPADDLEADWPQDRTALYWWRPSTGGLMNSGKAQTTSMPYSGRKVNRGHLRRSQG
jgi:hypothetical protein